MEERINWIINNPKYFHFGYRYKNRCKNKDKQYYIISENPFTGKTQNEIIFEILDDYLFDVKTGSAIAKASNVNMDRFNSLCILNDARF